jgi:cysteinyl-tRNA synthetase
MPKFKTSTGTVTVENWGYQLQGQSGHALDPDLLSEATYDLLVIDASRDGTDANRFTDDEIERMKDGMGGRSLVASYLSIGEADDFRDYWHKDWTTNGKANGTLTDAAPDWLGLLNPDWPESRKVRYWDSGWQHIMYNNAGTGDLDAIVKAGFDAAYLDIVDAYYFWGAEVKAKDREPGDPTNEKQAAQRMVDFVVDMTDHAREENPDFFMIPQNGAWIIDALRAGKPDHARINAYYDAIGGIAVEDLYYRGGKDENNRLQPDEATIRVLKRDFLNHGIPVFVTDYVNHDKNVAHFEKLALADGFIPYAAPDRDLDQLGSPFNGGPTYIHPTSGADILHGSQLADTIMALAGNDHVDGRGGSDKLSGGAGRDVLTGGQGADIFLFDTKPVAGNLDRITDFATGTDRIRLDHDVFGGLSKGALPSGAFASGTSAGDADDRILFDSSTGNLYFDHDGKGGDPAVAFAHVATGTTPSVGDFWVV